jgi:hypothetical protein
VPARNVRAVAAVESSGSGYDDQGRPKILFERHLFHRMTKGRWSVCSFSNGESGGYHEPSWDKLAAAACKDPAAAFSSASWGKFQVLGLHWLALGYPRRSRWPGRRSAARPRITRCSPAISRRTG